MGEIHYPIAISCPWCKKGETLADKPADINVSIRCPKCMNFNLIDFSKQRAFKARAKPYSAVHRKIKQ